MAEDSIDQASEELKLMMVIIQPKDADLVVDHLLRDEYRVTRINSTGGFLRQDQVTLLIGVEKSQTEEVLRIIRFCCHPHAEMESSKTGMTRRRAMVFILGVESLVGI
jgi:uncharacterized protein YaaQ